MKKQSFKKLVCATLPVAVVAAAGSAGADEVQSVAAQALAQAATRPVAAAPAPAPLPGPMVMPMAARGLRR
jgi:hypothetical protein